MIVLTYNNSGLSFRLNFEQVGSDRRVNIFEGAAFFLESISMLIMLKIAFSCICKKGWQDTLDSSKNDNGMEYTIASKVKHPYAVKDTEQWTDCKIDQN